jgi:hypothetical protein
VAGALTGALVGTGLPGEAAAATSRSASGPLLPGPDRHLVSRFSYGITPALAATVRRAGGARRWFEEQLDPASVADADADAVRAWWPSLDLGPAQLWDRQIQEIEGGWEVMESYQRWLLVRRMRTNRQVAEVMTEFWQHLLNVPVTGDAAFTYRTAYDRMVRANALGRFETLLFAAVTHPAMGIYLDNAVSSALAPNENLGRELLELHTVGRGAYDEDDVKASARILTGWRVDVRRTWAADYQPSQHWVGPVTVMGFSDPNASRDGREVTRRYLSYLARHPRTAQRIARRLAVKFVRDDPPQALVDRLAKVYLDHDTEIKPVLLALVGAAEFRSAAGAKVRDPGEDVVATYRALGVTLRRPPAGSSHAANAVLWQASAVGIRPFGWPQPDGQPLDNESWSSPSRLMASMEVHYSMAGGWWPDQGIDYRSPSEWLPDRPTRRTRVRVKVRTKKRGRTRWKWVWRWTEVPRPLRFSDLVDHLSRELLHTASTPLLLRACCQAVDVRADEVIDKDHDVVRWQFPRLLTTLLDSPTHLVR